MRNFLTSIFILIIVGCSNIKSVYEKQSLDTNDNSIKNVLEKLNAKESNKTILVFTSWFENDSLELVNGNESVFNKKLNTMSSGLAIVKVLDNNKKIKITFSSKDSNTIILKESMLKKYKFIYISKDSTNKKEYLIKYSNVYIGFS